MNFGVAIFPTEDTQDPAELARMAEDRGFESLLFPEHTHIPASRETPYPAGGELPPEYSRMYDPFVALTAAASATRHLRIGTAVCLIIERDPIVTAKQVASVDRLSDGRFLFGVGAGWNIEEMRNHGTDAASRFGRMRESVEAVKTIWRDDEATYAGRHVRFKRIWCWPKPAQQPHPPILVGGNGPNVHKRVIAFGDEWMPNRIGKDEDMIARFADLQRSAAEAGRPQIPVTQMGMMRDPARIEAFDRAGVHRGVFWLPPRGPQEVEQAMDRYAAAAESYRRAGG
ncbi:MAG: LLM class F420-dependent oxidoreductase [Solirubrobacteraceae bacterium]